ncbi:putative ferric reductase [Nakamurella sp. UYEF19]|uniref:ferredoxin reductase family protein n=1 Tax=Nakamurella sp. UYEF19 TaxID=1756392 RepID=UPI0033917E22
MKRDRFARRFLTGIGSGAVGAAVLALVRAPWPLPMDAALLAHVTGLLAGYLVAVMVILMSRMPVLDRRIGSDTLARWHGKGGRIFLILVLVHAGAAVQSWADARQEGILSSMLDVLGLPGLATATLGTALFIGIAVISIRAARRKLSYETWHGVHLLTYLAIALSFDHELAGPNLAGVHPLQIGWSLLYAWAFALVLRYRILAPVGNLWRHRLRVEAVIPEAKGVASIILAGRHLAELQAESGQFFRWRFLTARTWRSAHPFSLSAPPLDNEMRITVKALGTGSTLLHSMRPGTLVFAEGPSGSMTARKRTQPSVLLIAGGVGITPMRALFETLEHRGGRITLLYRASSEQDVVFDRELRSIAHTRGAEIIWMIGRSSEPANQLTADNLRRLVPDVAQRDVYLCASPALSTAVRRGLSQAGLPPHRLHEEVFDF